MTANANYGAALAEDFTPPENWVPGQKIDKNVGVVNTGNVDAFVRTWLEGEMRVVKETSTGIATWNNTNGFVNSTTTLVAKDALTSGLSSVTDEKLKSLNLNYKTTVSGTDYYFRELTKTKNDNPDPTKPNDSNPDAYSEVMAVQAGGQLVYTSGTKFKYTPNQSLTVQDTNNEIQNIVAGYEYTVTIASTTYGIDVTNDDANSKGTISITNLSYLPSVDSDSFVPSTTGLYIFKRNSDLNTALGSDDMEVAGYYYVATKTDETTTTDTSGGGVYLALHNDDNNRSDYVLPDSAVSKTYTSSTNTWAFAPTSTLQLYTAERTTVDNSDLTWTYHAPVTTSGSEAQGYLQAANGDIKINVYLANILGTGDTATTSSLTDTKNNGLEWVTAKTDAESWTPIFTTRSADDTWGAAASEQYTFYYNNDVEEGCSTERFVDSVELDTSVEKDDYLAFDFDLNVKMESTQVTIDETGKEGFATVTAWSATDSNTTDDGTDNIGATGAAGTVTNNEIEMIAWTYSAP